MITEREIIEIHSILIERFGGLKGIRDYSLLDSAINRPYQIFDGNDLYPTAIEKAAAIIESIVKNHPFIDGNKRTGYVLARLILMENSLKLSVNSENKYQFVIGISTGKLSFEDIKEWLELNCTK